MTAKKNKKINDYCRIEMEYSNNSILKFLVIFFTTVLLCFIFGKTFSQNAEVQGIILDSDFKPLQAVNVMVKDKPLGTNTNERGEFKITVPANVDITLSFSFIGYKTQEIELNLKSGEISNQKITLENNFEVLPEASIIDHSDRYIPMVRIDPTISLILPTVGGFEDILKTLPQVSSNNELSSMYSVRGGNFDENLVFVNDIEIFRPTLTRSGNQEGMSFINSDMVSGVTFSAGGFEPKYGDKMSSVLDIKYKKPNKFGATAYISLLGAGLHVEGISKNQKFRFNTGLRYKTTRYLLTSMDKQGSYDPNFIDFQTYMTYDVSEKYEIAFLGNISNNSYKFVPENMKMAWGSWNDKIGISMYFEGREIDRFTNVTAAFINTYKLNKNLTLKFIVSGYNTSESETFDILTQYFLNQINDDMNQRGGPDSIANIGIGSLLDHARNKLFANILSVKQIGILLKNNHRLEWGIQYNYEDLLYRVNEWNMKDSAGYSLPYSNNNVYMYNTDFGVMDFGLSRINAYIQDAYVFDFNKIDLSLIGGIRLNYLTFNKEFLAAPRITIALKPNWEEKNIVFRFSTGLYHQTPTYKEMRMLGGTINYNIKSQSSVQAVLACDWDFRMWERKFKFTTEAFYKYLYNINPYSVDNVRIKYYGDNIAKGYAYGIEAKVNGEFVKGTDSWFSIAFLKTKEKINGAYTLTKDDKTGMIDTISLSNTFVERPTDQMLNLSIFFQDYIPKNPTWQVNLSLLFGTALPYTLLTKDKMFSGGRLRPYRRVDLGILKQLITPARPLPKGNIFKMFKELWVSLEVFNLLDINNTISYSWVTSTNGDQYGVPNYLTSRRLNVKIIAKF